MTQLLPPAPGSRWGPNVRKSKGENWTAQIASPHGPTHRIRPTWQTPGGGGAKEKSRGWKELVERADLVAAADGHEESRSHRLAPPAAAAVLRCLRRTAS